MGQVRNIIEEWCAGNPEKEEFYAQRPGLVLRWINEGQLRYASNSEILRGTWSPTTASDGSIALPTDFLREFPDRVKYTDYVYLRKISYADAKIMIWSTTTHYSIFGETLYIFSPVAATLTIPYIKRPSTIVIANINTADFDSALPPEFDHTLRLYLDAQFAGTKDTGNRLQLESAFDEQSEQDGFKYIKRHDPVPQIRPSLF